MLLCVTLAWSSRRDSGSFSMYGGSSLSLLLAAVVSLLHSWVVTSLSVEECFQVISAGAFCFSGTLIV